jgi:hypothetical protein
VKSRKVFGFRVYDLPGGKSVIDGAFVLDSRTGDRWNRWTREPVAAKCSFHPLACGALVYTPDVERMCLELIRHGMESWAAYGARQEARAA